MMFNGAWVVGALAIGFFLGYVSVLATAWGLYALVFLPVKAKDPEQVHTEWRTWGKNGKD